GPVLERLQLAEDAIAAVHGVGQLVAVLPETLAHRRPRPGDDVVDAGDGVRVAHAGEADVALSDLARALQLHPQLGSRDEAGPGDASRAVVELLVDALAHVDVPAQEVFVVGIAPLVHGVGGHRGHGAALLRQHGRDLDVLHRDLAHDRFLPGVRLGAEGRALHDLAVEVGERLRVPLPDRGRREDGAVAAAPADDDVRPQVQQLDEGVHPGQGDDVVGGVELGQRQVRPPVEAAHGVAGPDASAYQLLRDLGVEIAELEAGDPVALGQRLDDVHVAVDPAVAAGVPRRSDHHRQSEAAGADQHDLDVVRLPGGRAHAGGGPQPHRT